MYATLMVHLELGHPNTALLQLAGDLAERLHSSVVGAAMCQPMPIIYNDGYIPSDVIEQDRQQIESEMKAAEAEFHAVLGGRVEISGWRSIVTSMALSTQLANEARCADLVITGVGPKASLLDVSRHLDLGDFVMHAGRPCLIVPEGTASLGLGHVVVGWKDTGETRRAARDALPLLKQAGRVTVAEIAPEEDLANASGRLREVVGWLKRHGIEANPLAARSTGDDAAALEAIIQDQAADLLVAGAYGHSRLREWVLGGVTRNLLLRASRCSLVSH
jgi:nucleotide-binding universal stress UspA family protein